VVSNIFKELGLIEQWGSGINRIISACEEHGLQTPKIAEQNDFFDIEFYRPITTNYDRLADDKTSDTVGKPSEKESFADNYGRLRTITDDYERLEDTEKQILLYLLDNKTITRKTAVELLNLQKTKVHEILAGLSDKVLIEKQGQGRSTFYTLVKMEGKK
jgi:ATP-dependent DNA helicase RecG